MDVVNRKYVILNTLNMQDILEKYGITLLNGNMFHCPFHKDTHASSKCYEKTFYCFSCNRTGDFIQFVEYLYHLSFKQAMKKISDDFNLKLDLRTGYDKNRIMQIEKERQIKRLRKQAEKEYFVKLCKLKNTLNTINSDLQKKITKDNWENRVLAISYLQEEIEKLDIFICNRYNLPY